MSDPRRKIQEKFKNNRFANFGNIVSKIQIKGIRCHKNTIIDIKSPITALCGPNGCGKSTILQIASCIYKQSKRISDYIKKGIFDIPFTTEAEVFFTINKDNRNSHTYRLYYDDNSSKWRYNSKKKPERNTFFAGVGCFIPRYEIGDSIFRSCDRIQVNNSLQIDSNTVCQIRNVLLNNYESAHSHNLNINTRKGNCLLTLKLDSQIEYSDMQMGFGEGRTVFLIDIIEKLPGKSLILVEEPEISLHPYAQYQLGKYFTDVCNRKGHQIILTTHSEHLLSALHRDSRVLMYKESDGIKIVQSISTKQALTVMNNFHSKSLKVFVEDEWAKAILSEIIGRIDKLFLSTIDILPVGGHDEVKKTYNTMSTYNKFILCAIVLDGDQRQANTDAIDEKKKKLREIQDRIERGEDVNNDEFNKINNELSFLKKQLFLPGSQPPEIEVFINDNVISFTESKYRVNIKSELSIQSNHHSVTGEIARKANQEKTHLISELSGKYVDSLPESDLFSFVQQLKDLFEE